MASSSHAGAIRIVVKAAEGFAEKVVRKLALDIVANLVAAPSEGGTPVDTGWARANWLPRVGSPATGTVGSPTSVTRSAQQAGLQQVATWKMGAGKVWITNAVPYIGRLNAGWSKQAPAGFVQAAIRRAVAELRA